MTNTNAPTPHQTPSSISILIVEDEVLIAEYLKDTLASFGFNKTKLAHSKADALEAITAFKPELILLDIRMDNELDGISIAQTITASYKIPFIFITAHADAEIIRKALDTKPCAYLTKPFKKMDVFAAISLALKEIEHRNKKFVFKDGHTTVALGFDELQYIESEGNYIFIVTSNRKYTVRYSLEWCLQQLPEDTFKRIHRSFIINTSKITKDSAKAVSIGEKSIPKSRGRSMHLL